MCDCCFKYLQKKRMNKYTVNEELLKNNENECSICLCKLRKNKCIKTGCEHYFHLTCYTEYVFKFNHLKVKEIACPYCRENQDELNNIILVSS